MNYYTQCCYILPVQIQVQDQLLKNLPKPSERQLSAIDILLEDVFCQHGLSDADLAFRTKVLQKLQEVVSKEVPSNYVKFYFQINIR